MKSSRVQFSHRNPAVPAQLGTRTEPSAGSGRLLRPGQAPGAVTPQEPG